MCGGGHEMTAGVHCAHFEMRTLNVSVLVGVAGPGFDPAAGGEANGAVEGWLMRTHDGSLVHGGSGSGWAGQPEEHEGKVGDVVVRRPPCAALRRGCAEGLACACRAWCSTSTPAGETPVQPIRAILADGGRVVSLTVWLNGERRGVMVPSGLAGPLRGAVDLGDASVRIDGPKPPPG